MQLDAGKVKKTKKQKMERNGDPRLRQEMVHFGFRHKQEMINKNKKVRRINYKLLFNISNNI